MTVDRVEAQHQGWSEFSRELFPDGGIPAERWKFEVAFFMYHRGYDPGTIAAALAHAAAHGSFEGCPELGFWGADRGRCEAFLPEAPEVEWGTFPGYWALGA